MKNDEHDAKPDLRIVSVAESADWLAEHAGTGHLSGLFRRSGRIAHCLRIGHAGSYVLPAEDDDGPASVRDVTPTELAAEVQYTFACYKTARNRSTGEEFPVKATFPEAAAKLAVAAPHKMRGLRPLVGVVHTPIVRAGGTILNTPGYDEATRLLYLPDPGLDVPVVPEDPTAAQVAAARDLVLEMIEDYEFQTDHDRANAVGFFLTPLLRLLAPPAYKLFAVGAPQPGSGKTMLANLGRILHGGVFRPEMPREEAELEKTLSSILSCTTAPVVIFDNVEGVLRSSKLAAMLTSADYSGRILGSTNSVDLVNDRAWCVTGNNLTLGGDLVRRTVQITIDTRCPDPENRTEFHHLDLEKWVADNRGEIVAALLTLVRAWVAAGRPARRSVGADSFARWVEVVDGILGVAGIDGTFDHSESRRVKVGEDDREWNEFLEAVSERFGDDAWTVKEMLGAVAMPHDEGDEFAAGVAKREREAGKTIPLETMPAELAEKVMRGRMGPAVVAKSMGRWLANREGRYAGGSRMTVRSAGKDSHTKVARWRVEVLASDSSEPEPARPLRPAV